MKINIINKIKPHVNKNVWEYLKINKLCVKYCEEFLRHVPITGIDAYENLTISSAFVWIHSKDGHRFWENIYYNYRAYELAKNTKEI